MGRPFAQSGVHLIHSSIYVCASSTSSSSSGTGSSISSSSSSGTGSSAIPSNFRAMGMLARESDDKFATVRLEHEHYTGVPDLDNDN